MYAGQVEAWISRADSLRTMLDWGGNTSAQEWLKGHFLNDTTADTSFHFVRGPLHRRQAHAPLRAPWGTSFVVEVALLHKPAEKFHTCRANKDSAREGF